MLHTYLPPPVPLHAAELSGVDVLVARGEISVADLTSRWQPEDHGSCEKDSLLDNCCCWCVVVKSNSKSVTVSESVSDAETHEENIFAPHTFFFLESVLLCNMLGSCCFYLRMSELTYTNIIYSISQNV